MNWTAELFGMLATTAAIIGTVMNARQMRECFYIWLFSNAVTCCLHVGLAAWSLAARDATFFLLAIYGLLRWRTPQGPRERVCDAFGVELAPGEDADRLDPLSMFCCYPPDGREVATVTFVPAVAAGRFDQGFVIVMR